MDYDEKSLLAAAPDQRRAAMAVQRGILRDGIAILQPRSVVFLTGPNYDKVLADEFPGVELQPFSRDHPQRRVAVLRQQDLPTKSVRTYHPNYLNRSKRWHIVAEIAAWTKGA